MKRILLPLSGQEAHEAVVPLVSALARHTGATLRLLRVYPVPDVIMQSPDLVGARARVVAYADQQMDSLTAEGRRYLETVEAQLDGVPTERVVRFGDPTREILTEADAFDADLIALATTTRSRLRSAFVPSVAERVARQAGTRALVLTAE